MKALLDRPLVLVDLGDEPAPQELRLPMAAAGGPQLARYELLGPGLPGEVNYRYVGTADVPQPKEEDAHGRAQR